MKLLWSIVIFFLFISTSFAQVEIKEADLELTSLMGSPESMPFWLTHNQLGKYDLDRNFQTLFEGRIVGSTEDDRLTSRRRKQFNFGYGIDFATLVTSDETKPMIIQAYGELSNQNFRFKVGAFADEENFGGLASSNGEMLRSLNYRPYPRIQLSTNGFIPLY